MPGVLLFRKVEDMPIGIYIICGPNESVYVGSTQEFNKRKRTHIEKLKNGKHHTAHLQNAWNLYGEDAFTFAFIDLCDYSKLLVREQYWIDYFIAALGRKNVYNTNLIAGSNRGTKQTQETIERRSKKLRGKKRNAQSIDRIKAASKIRGILKETQEKAWKRSKSRTKEELDQLAYMRSGGKVYTAVSPDNTVYENILNLKAFCDFHNLNYGNMQGVTKGTRKQHKGWTINYAKNNI